MTSKEKLPDIYSTKLASDQSIKQRNEVIDEYIKSLENNKGESKQNEVSAISEDEKDPFSNDNIKNLKPIKSSKNKLILPNFKKRENIKSHSSSYQKQNKYLKQKKNYSESNIHRIHKDERLPSHKEINNNLNSKWSTCSSSYTNYINFYKKNTKNNANCNLFKFRNDYSNIYNQRNYTAIIGQKFENKKIFNQRINSTLNTKKILENKRQIYEKLIKEKNNPYGLNWINKIFKKNNNEKIELSKKQFKNGVPIIKLLGKKDMNKRDIKKKLNEIQRKKKEEENEYNKIIHAKAKLNEDELDDEYNIPNEILEQFNQNKKNFFKLRKDIIEMPDEEDQVIDK
jgi:hypothetical protein